jgi:hypothetical protein
LISIASCSSPSPPASGRDAMTDFIFVVITVWFFAISIAYARGLDRI